MELQLTEDFVKENELNEKQVTALKGFIEKDFVPTIKKEYDGMANANAEKILEGAAKKTKEVLGIDFDREQGEKIADYIERATKSRFEKVNNDLAQKQKEIDEKLKNFKGGDEFKTQLEQLKSEKDALLQQVAELEPLKGLDEKYKQKDQELSGLKLNWAFTEVKPSFPETVNKYEADAKWNAFKSDVLLKYNIEIVDGKAVAVDKENQYKQTPLSELVSQNKEIEELLQGRQQGGTGAKPVATEKVDGVPFPVPKGASGTERAELIRNYLATKGIGKLHPNYAEEFANLNTAILKGQTPAA